ncbi:MAG: sulfite exporter TauE/SafE family protein [Gammaproteobacteria bacterium]|nr:sulfite exporter TauE/SafE family protein [Gammaproteobacteria bacterium]
MAELILLYLLIGGVAGLLAGLLGVGGGLVIVPFLYWAFTEQGLPIDWIMHLSIGTSLATITCTSLSSVSAHHHHKAVRWDLFRLLLPGILLGGWLGGVVARQIETDTLQIFFALFELLVAIQMGLGLRPDGEHKPVGWRGNGVAGGLIGVVSALVGIGGGTMTVPWLVWNRVVVHQAIGTSAAVGLPIAIAGSAGFIWSGWEVEALPRWSSGFVYWPAFAGIVVMSVLAAPLGARLAHHLPAKRLKQLFALLLLLLSVRMFVA